jgi:hypothetical protein
MCVRVIAAQCCFFRTITASSVFEFLFELYDVTRLVCDYRRGMDWKFDLMTRLGTTSICSAISDLHTLQITWTL